MISGQDFYFLSDPGRASSQSGISPVYGISEWLETYGLAEADGIDYEQVVCPIAPRHHMRAGKRIGDLKLILATRQIADFIWTWTGECVITDRVLSLFREASLTGFEVGEATITKLKGKGKILQGSLPRVWELIVTGNGGDAHPDSGIRLLYKCTGCGLTRYSSFHHGIRADSNKWDGSDFFTVTGYPSFRLITGRALDVVVRNRLTNCVILRSEDIEWGDIPKPEDHMEDFIPSGAATKG